MDLLRHFEQQMRTVERPYLQPGDVVRVEMKVHEGGKTRLQAFEGTLLGIRGSGPSATITVRRETGHFGVERIFPLYSPLIEKIDIVKRQKVRRAKLTYLRQAGRRRFKEDVKAMQRHIKEEEDKKRLAALRQAQAEKAAEKKRLAAAAAEAMAAKEEEAAKKAEETKQEVVETAEDKQAETKAAAADETIGKQ